MNQESAGFNAKNVEDECRAPEEEDRHVEAGEVRVKKEVRHHEKQDRRGDRGDAVEENLPEKVDHQGCQRGEKGGNEPCRRSCLQNFQLSVKNVV
jgi:hypothetical protein